MNQRVLSCIAVAGATSFLLAFAPPGQTPGQPRPAQERPTTDRPVQINQPNQARLEPLRALAGTWQVTAKLIDASAIGASTAPTHISGTATREWVLNNQFLHEEFNASATAGQPPLGRDPIRDLDDDDDLDDLDEDIEDIIDDDEDDVPDRVNPARPTTPAQQPQSQRQSIGGASGLEGMGMIGWDENEQKYSFFWADGMSGTMSLLTGNYNAATKTFTFTTPGAQTMTPGQMRPGQDRPGDTTRPGGDRPGLGQPGEDRPGQDRPGQDRPGQDRPGQDRPGIGQPDRLTTTGHKDLLVTVRVVDDNRHVVEVLSRDPAAAGGVKRMEITYTKGDTGTRPGLNRPGGAGG